MPSREISSIAHGRSQNSIYGTAAGVYLRSGSAGPMTINLPSTYFVEPPVVSLTIQSDIAPTQGQYGYPEQLLDVSTSAFSATTLNGIVGSNQYHVHWIAFGVIGYSDMPGRTTSAGASRERESRRKRT
jgi:hypothetical protein